MGEGGIKSVLRLFHSYNYFSFKFYEAMVTDQLIKKHSFTMLYPSVFKNKADTTGSHIGEFECHIRQSAPISPRKTGGNRRN